MSILKPTSSADPGQQRSARARILHSGAAADADRDPVPFVPAYDLLERQDRRLSEEEAAAVGLALSLALPEPVQHSSAWGIAGRLERIFGERSR